MDKRKSKVYTLSEEVLTSLLDAAVKIYCQNFNADLPIDKRLLEFTHGCVLQVLESHAEHFCPNMPEAFREFIEGLEDAPE